MTTVENLANLEREFTSVDGFFMKLHQREFDPQAATRFASLMKTLSLSSNHEANYGLLWFLWGAQIDLENAVAHGIGGAKLTELREGLFPEFARIFDAELHGLVERLRMINANRS